MFNKSIIIFLFGLLTIGLHADVPAQQAKIFPDNLTAARWIWHPTKLRRGAAELFCRTSIFIPQSVKKAKMHFIGDDSGTFYVNGVESTNDFTNKLKKGKNWLAFHVKNTDSGFGLIFRGDIEYDSGKKICVVSNKNAKTSSSKVLGWLNVDFDDSKWENAIEFGDANAAPWSIYSNIVKKMGSLQEQKRYDLFLKKAYELDKSFIEKLKNEPACQAKITWENNQPFIEMNGKLYPPVIRLGLKPGTLQSDDFVFKMKNSSIPFYGLHVNTDTKGLWKGEGGPYDFSSLSTQANRLLKMNPNAYFTVSIYFSKMGSSAFCVKTL